MEKSKIISGSELKILKLVGEGTHALVYHANWQGISVAVKKFRIELSKFSQTGLKNFETEAKILQNIEHPNVIRYYGKSLSEIDYPSLVLEYLPRGTLYFQLHDSKVKLPFWKQLQLASQIAAGISYLHNLQPKIIHRNLTSLNILLDENWIPKITGFGLSKVKTETQTMTQMVENSAWMAPELLENIPSNEKVDVYSFGLILYEIASNILPFHDLSPIQMVDAIVVKRSRPTIPSNYDPTISLLIKNCWEYFHTARPTIFQIMARIEERMNQLDVRNDIYLFSEWEYGCDFLQSPKWMTRTQNSKTYDLSVAPPYSLENIELNRFFSVLKKLEGTSQYKFSKVIAVENSVLKKNFQSKVLELNSLMENDIHTYRTQTWKEIEQDRCKWYLNELQIVIESFQFSTDPELNILPLFCAVKSETQAWNVCDNGFDESFIIKDGWFGAGMYFSTNLDYIIQEFGTKSKQGEYFVFLSYVILGNPYPCIANPNDTSNSLKGKKYCINGYHSHYSLVQKNHIPVKMEKRKDMNDPIGNKEFVIFDKNQIFIKYLLFVSSNN